MTAFIPQTLRPYQHRAIERLRDAIRRGRKRIILSAPCRSGKTTVFIEIARNAVARGGRVLILAERRELVNQPMMRYGAGAGVILAGDDRADAAAPVQIASVQSLGRRLSKIAFEPTIICVDECHHCTAKSYMEILARWPDAYILGFSGTPFRQSGRGLGEVFEEIIEISNVRELLELGHLVPVRTYVCAAPDMSGVSTVAGDYAKGAMEAAVMESGISGDVVKEYLRLGEGRSAIYYAAGVEHSKELTARFIAAGVKASHIDGETDKEERARILAALADGSITVVCNDSVLCEGFDCARVSLIGLCRPTKSRNRWRQCSMRGMGSFPEIGKVDCVLLDHAGCTDIHGFVTDADVVSLEAGVKKPRKQPELSCPACGQPLAGWPKKCPACGIELPRTPPEALVEDPTKRLQEIDAQTHRASVYLRMVLDAQSRGHKPGSAYVRFLQQFGEPPTRKDKGLVIKAKLIRWDDAARTYVWTTPPPKATAGEGRTVNDDLLGAWPGR